MGEDWSREVQFRCTRDSIEESILHSYLSVKDDVSTLLCKIL